MCIHCPAELARNLDGAFAKVVEHHQDQLYSMSRRMSRTDADAEDLAQDTFVRAYRALRGYDSDRIRALQLRGWLAQICLNLARNRARSGRAGNGPSGPARPLQEAPDMPDTRALPPDRAAEQRETTQRWVRLLEELPERYRIAVALRHVEAMSYPELSVALRRPLNTVKSDVHRGVSLLRVAYERDGAADWRADTLPSTVMEVSGRNPIHQTGFPEVVR